MWITLLRTLTSRLCLGSYFSLDSDSLSSLQTLTQKLADHGMKDTKEILWNWVVLLDLGGQFGVLVTTFAEEFAATEAVSDDGSASYLPSARWFGRDANSAAVLLGRMLTRFDVGPPDEAMLRLEQMVLLFHVIAGLTETDQDVVSGHPTRWLETVDASVADEVMLSIAFGCSVTGRPNHVIALLESRFLAGLEGCKSTADAHAALLARHPMLGADQRMRVMLMTVWVQAMILMDRRHHGATLIEVLYPEIFSSTGDEFAYEKLFAVIREMPVEICELCLVVIAWTLLQNGKNEGCRKLVEKHLNISLTDYDLGRGALKHKLSKWRDGHRDHFLHLHIYTLAVAIEALVLPRKMLRR